MAGPLDPKLNDPPEETPNVTTMRLKRLREIIGENTDLTREYIVMNFLATVVASYGLLQNSTAVVIGAMIIALLLGPINGLALALNDGNWNLLRRAGTAEGIGVVIVLITSMLIGKFHSEVDVLAQTELMMRTAPNILDLLIALGGGAAGAYAVVSPKLKSGAVGVAIATALVPPLATCGIMLAHGHYSLSANAFILFFTNLVTIQAAASAVFWFYGLHTNVKKEQSLIEMCRRNGISLGILAALGVFLAITFQSSINKSAREKEISDDVNGAFIYSKPGTFVQSLNVDEKSDHIDVFCMVYTPVSYTPEDIQEIERNLVRQYGKEVNLTVQSILTKEANNSGWLHEGTNTDNDASPKTSDPNPNTILAPPSGGSTDPTEDPKETTKTPIKDIDSSTAGDSEVGEEGNEDDNTSTDDGSTSTDSNSE